jgi:hypothetical protein
LRLEGQFFDHHLIDFEVSLIDRFQRRFFRPRIKPQHRLELLQKIWAGLVPRGSILEESQVVSLLQDRHTICQSGSQAIRCRLGFQEGVS